MRVYSSLSRVFGPRIATKLTATVSPKRVAQTLIFVALFLTLASAVAEFIQISLGLGNSGFLPVLFVGKDDSVPEWYSSITLLFCSVLLAMIAYAKRTAGDRFFLHWGALSAIFLYLSADEGFSIHERMGPLGELILEGTGLDPGGFIIRAWIVPGIILVLVVALTYLRFLIALPPKIRNSFLLAGLLFVGGAIGMEVLRDFHTNLYGGVENMSLVQIAIRLAISYVEEFSEMLGVIVFIYTLMLYAGAQAKEA